MSAVPAALDALVALFGSRVSAQIIDGPPTQDVAGDVVAVGLAPSEPVDVQSTETIAGFDTVEEFFDVLCLARSWSGNDGVKAQRDRTYVLLDAAKTAVLEDPTLSGVVTRARFSGSTYMPWRTERGQLVVDVSFRVAIHDLP